MPGVFDCTFVSMNKPLTYRDICLLDAKSFETASLWTWFGRDRAGQLWQAQEADDNHLLQFRKVHDKYTEGWEPMNRQTFEELF